MTRYKKPSALQPGDTVGIMTPSFPAPVRFPERYERGLQQLRQMGFRVIEGACARQTEGYRSASIQARADEFNALIRDPEVKAVISTIGGTNSNSLLPYLDYDALRRNPKIIMGYSDVTALLLACHVKAGVVTFYGPAIVPSFGEYGGMFPDGERYVRDVLCLECEAPYRLDVPEKWTEEMIDWATQDRVKSFRPNEGWLTLREGEARGPLIGGNLNTMSGFLKSEFFPNLTGAILFIEDSFKTMAEEERSLSMLKLAGVFDEIAGLIVGKHEHFDTAGAPFSFESLLLEVVGDVTFPIMTNVDIGHTFPSHVFPIGIDVLLDATNGTLTFLENGVTQ
ncbi:MULTISPECIES: S66 family peptidase [Exiguobacterium]|uniref:S66 family peptidase n=1 Tax=Exiguobacterium TaxID=33986 RepID=UPI001BE7A597|nr:MULTISPECIES: S66 peptidase family protein [Exiguobacterium]MCT4783623.1 LD-carboxypeptidase [Exiguobacterium himgiriensis]